MKRNKVKNADTTQRPGEPKPLEVRDAVEGKAEPLSENVIDPETGEYLQSVAEQGGGR